MKEPSPIGSVAGGGRPIPLRSRLLEQAFDLVSVAA